ncbi:family 2 encapsulin nanocompartment cargo protein terpene cyclase [Nocardia sp. NPDC051030]|uniref:family 2 encapsulin nanocompartment cargo protein terpene cyclase n=1 Tax=Nocardia sp. NPDC051030 TaxID=3155162 RepID=UPI0034494D78
MSVLSRAAAPPATHEVAAAVAALLENLDANAPHTLPFSNQPGVLDDSRLDESDAAEVHVSAKRLLGPVGLGSASILVDLPDVLAESAAPPRPAPRSNGVGRPPPPLRPQGAEQAGTTGPPVSEPAVDPESGAAPPLTNGAAGSEVIPGVRRIPNGPAGLGSASALQRIPLGPTGLESSSQTQRNPLAPTEPGSSSPAQRIPPGSGAVGSASATRQIPHAGFGRPSAPRKRAAGSAIPPLYCPPPQRDDPVLAEAVNTGIIAWAKEIGLYEGRLDELHKANFGRLIMLAHPNCDDADRLLAAAKCAVSEWSVDDYYCEEDASDIAPDGSHSSAEAELGPRLELCAAAMDPVHLPARYQAQVEKAMRSDPILRAFRTSFEHLAKYASPAQLARLRTEIAGWFIALGAEAGWRGAGRMPPVWEYLLNRQPHSFLPCMAPIDAVDGYELSAAEYTDPRMRRVTTTAALAAQMVNDLYSMAREDLSNGREFNLPTVLAAEEKCSRREAVQRTAEVHDELMHRFEAEAGALAATGSPELRRFLGGLWAWMGGNRAWHADSRRYND